MLRISTILLLLLLNITLSANVITWLGNKSEDWHDPLNWDSDTVPIAGDDVVIDGNATVNLINNAAIKTLVLSNGATLSLDDSAVLTLQADGLFSNRINILGGSNLVINKGEIIVESGHNMGINIEDGNLINLGIIVIQSAEQRAMSIGTDGQLENEGEITITNGRTYGIINLGILNNKSDGEITVSKGGALSGFQSGLHNSAIGTLTNFGSITIDSTGRLSLDNRGTLINNATISISNASVGLRNDHTLENNGSITLTQSNSINFINKDTLLNKGSFIINSSTTTAIDNEGPIINEGTMNIDAGNAVGIINSSTIENTLTSTLSVTSEIQAITNFGMITNRGILDCIAGTGSGVFNDSIFINLGGTVSMSSSGQGIINNPDDSVFHFGRLNLIGVKVGILNLGNFSATGSVEYYYPDTTTEFPISIAIDNRTDANLETRKLTIHNFAGTGIKNSGYHLSDGKVDIYDFKGITNMGIVNTGILTVTDDNILGIFNSPLINTVGIETSGNLTVDGILNLTQALTNSLIINGGTTTIAINGLLAINPLGQTSLIVNPGGQFEIIGQMRITDQFIEF